MRENLTIKAMSGNAPQTIGMDVSSGSLVGLIIALLSSLFIGSSFIFKKKGLLRAGSSGTRAGVGGYSYLLEPLWWAGMITMIVGEIANFVAYVFAPAVLVSPLGALSIIVSASLAHVMLKERLNKLGMLGCIMCIVGSVVIVLHAPEESSINSMKQVWKLATQPAFLMYTASVVAIVVVLVLHFAPRYGHLHVTVFVGICSLMGSLSVMSVKALGIAITLTFEGKNQFGYIETWIFVTVVITCILTQMVYLNKALDTFNTAIVSPVYYVMFTSLTIIASVIMFKDWDGLSATSVVSELCGFITIVSGTIILHMTKDINDSKRSLSFLSGMSPSLSTRLANKTIDAGKHSEEGELPAAATPLCRHEMFLSP